MMSNFMGTQEGQDQMRAALSNPEVIDQVGADSPMRIPHLVSTPG